MPKARISVKGHHEPIEMEVSKEDLPWVEDLPFTDENVIWVEARDFD